MPRERQLELCEKTVAAVDRVPALTSVYDLEEFDTYVQDFREADEISVLVRLMALAENSPRGRRPGVAFFLRLMRLRDVSLYILDAETGLRSIDGAGGMSTLSGQRTRSCEGVHSLPNERANSPRLVTKTDFLAWSPNGVHLQWLPIVCESGSIGGTHRSRMRLRRSLQCQRNTLNSERHREKLGNAFFGGRTVRRKRNS